MRLGRGGGPDFCDNTILRYGHNLVIFHLILTNKYTRRDESNGIKS